MARWIIFKDQNNIDTAVNSEHITHLKLGRAPNGVLHTSIHLNDGTSHITLSSMDEILNLIEGYNMNKTEVEGNEDREPKS